MLGGGVKVGPRPDSADSNGVLTSIKTIWFEGPLISQPASQRKEDYPKDMGGIVDIAGDATPGIRHWRLWNSEGATSAMKLVVGTLPEVLEEETDGEPLPVAVQLPVTINGRIFPREDIDIWSFAAKKGQGVVCEVHSARLGLPLDARLEVRDPSGKRISENDDTYSGDPFVRFTAPVDGNYQVHIHDINFAGGQDFVYRLTLTSGPHVERVFPLGGRRGDKVAVELFGQNLPGGKIEIAVPAASGDRLLHRVDNAGATSNDFALDVDDVAEIVETEPNNAAGNTPAELPAMFNGRISTPGEVDCWQWKGVKGDVIQFDLRAGRLQSPLDGVLIITDAAGKQLARAEVTAANQLDPTLDFKVPADGVYVVQVHERFRSRGGSEFAYRLRAGTAAADFQLSLNEDTLTIPRNGTAKVRVSANRLGGFNQAIALDVEGLPEDVAFTGNTIPPGKPFVDVVFKANEKAAIRLTRTRITGKAEVAGEIVKRVAARDGTPELHELAVAVAMPCPFKIESEYSMGFAPRGSVGVRHYKIERGGHEGPIEIRLADRQARHLQGVSGPSIVVPPGQSEFTYPLMLPPWMEMGRTCRVCVMGVGTIEENGIKHRVSYSSIEPNQQFIAVIGANQLSLVLKESSVSVPATGVSEVAVPVSVKRGEKIPGTVKIELLTPAHIQGVSAAAVTMPADRNEEVLRVRFAEANRGPFNMPLTIRATIMHEGFPVFTEARLEVIER